MNSPKPTKYSRKKRLTVKKYAELKGITTRTVYNQIKAGVLDYEQLKPHYRIEILL